jgi:hypothetical protein
VCGAAEFAGWVDVGPDDQAVGDHVVPGPLAGFHSIQKNPRKHGSAERLLMSARTNARAYGRERPVSASSTRIPRILLPIDCPALVARK